MTPDTTGNPVDRGRTVMVVGATRGLGLAVTREFVTRGWRVIATARDVDSPDLAALARAHADHMRVEALDIVDDAAISTLRNRIADERLDVLYINAGTVNGDVPVGDVPTDDFVHVMVTNALAPMRIVEQFGAQVAPTGMIAVVSSRQGSISFNTRGGQEVYRASKSALNQLMRSYAARPNRQPQTLLLLLHPGWVRTELGGPDAPLGVDESATGLVDVVEQNLGAPGLQFLDHTGAVVPW